MSKNIKQIFDFLHKIQNLKRTYRFKTVHNIEGDSVADHSWRMALMTFVIADELKLDVDVLKSLKLALTHDLPESITDDIDAKKKVLENIDLKEKARQEEKAMKEIKKMLPEKIGQELFDLWKEYEEGKTKEARFIKAVDKIEGAMAHLELSEGKLDSIEITAVHGHKDIKRFPEILELFRHFKEELKQEFKKENIEWKEEYDDYM